MSGAKVVTLGCRLNIAESERIAGLLTGQADTIVINSCAVTAEAVRQTRRAIRRARRARPEARLLVTGCAADIEGDSLSAMPEVDALVPNAAKLARDAWQEAGVVFGQSPAAHADAPPTPSRRLPSARTRAFVAVQNGCNHGCTFCVIPQGRGQSRSMTVAQVLAEVEQHLAIGAREVVLTGVDVTSWGEDLADAPRLGALVSAILDAFPRLERVRLSSIDGAEIDPLLEELLAGEERVMPHLHLSLQSGDDMILKRMKRRHSRAQAIALVERLKARRPAIAIGADLIAGFPTETEAMHQANLAIVEACEIVHGHIFPFSPRPGTPAARMPQCDSQAIRQRAAELRARVAAGRARWLGSLIGTRHAVLVENDGSGHSENFARFRAPTSARPGSIVAMTARRVDGGMIEGTA